MQKKVWLALAMVAALFTVKPGHAQKAAHARQADPSATELTRRAIECLHRGEAAATKEAQLAAYREGYETALRAIALDDSIADAHFAAFANNGRILLIDGVAVNVLNLFRARRELDRALELDPNHPDALAAKGGLYRQLPWALGGNLGKAEHYLKRAIEVDPGTILPRIELAQTYQAMGKPELAVPLLKEAIVLATAEGKQYRIDQAKTLLRELHAN